MAPDFPQQLTCHFSTYIRETFSKVVSTQQLPLLFWKSMDAKPFWEFQPACFPFRVQSYSQSTQGLSTEVTHVTVCRVVIGSGWQGICYRCNWKIQYKQILTARNFCISEITEITKWSVMSSEPWNDYDNACDLSIVLCSLYFMFHSTTVHFYAGFSCYL